MGESVVPQLINKYTNSPSSHKVTFSLYARHFAFVITSVKGRKKTDLAICSYIADEPEIDFIPIIQQELVVVTAKDHPLARLYDNEVDLVETVHYPYIYFFQRTAVCGLLLIMSLCNKKTGTGYRLLRR